MSDKIVLMATIPEREAKCREITLSLYDQVDEIRVVFNNYNRIPNWATTFNKIYPLLNTPDHYTSNAVWLLMDKVDGYVFVCDDDIKYPDNYAEVMIRELEKYDKQAVISMYGEIVKRPFRGDYKTGRYGYCFEVATPKDKIVDIVGVGCCIFHTDYLRPRIHDFPDIYSRDLWFSILAHKNKLTLVRPRSESRWLDYNNSPNSPEIRLIWRNNEQLARRRQQVFRNILLPLLKEKNAL